VSDPLGPYSDQRLSIVMELMASLDGSSATLVRGAIEHVIAAPDGIRDKNARAAVLAKVASFMASLNSRLDNDLRFEALGAIHDHRIEQDVRKQQKRLNDKFIELSSWEHLNEMGYFLAKGADINAVDKDGNTALIWSCLQKRIKSVKFLLDRGANTEARDKDGKTALIQAAWADHAEILELLLERGTNIEARDKDGNTALIFSGREGHTETTELLLAKGANVNAGNLDGDTALIRASSCGYTEIVKVLLDNDADVNIKNSTGWTALKAASLQRHTEIAELLRKHGATE
jgi:ankyrin repeat protein